MAGAETSRDRVERHWDRLDRCVARVTETAWGAVVTDPSSPRVWDVNHARVTSTDPNLRPADVEADARPMLERIGADRFHVVVLRPDRATELVRAFEVRGDRVRWELVMTADPAAARPDPAVPVLELDQDDPAFLAVGRAQDEAFDVHDPEIGGRLRALDRRLRAAGKRFVAVPDPSGPGGVAAIAAAVPGDGLVYVDNVVTFPYARGRGFASALVATILADAAASGADLAYLLADLDGGPVALYERLGFAPSTRIASVLEPLPGRGDQVPGGGT